MKLRQHILPWRRLVAMVVGMGVVAGAAGGEPIRFSKPAVPIAVQAKGEEGLPAARDKRPDFGADAIQQPAIAQPTIVHVQPREKEKDNEAGVHWLARDPKNFPDATGRANARDSLATRHDSNRRDSLTQDKSQTSSSSKWSSDGSDLKRSEGAHALSPITDFHWDGRSDGRSNSWSGTRLSNSDKKDPVNPNPFGRNFGRGESSEQNAESGSSFFSDLLVPRPKEKSTEAQLERRAAHERLLNPNTTVAGRSPGSLEPVTTVETSKSGAPVTMPSIASPRLDSQPLQPLDAFNQRQAQLRGPVVADFNKKYNNSTPTAPASAGAAVDPHFQTPLKRQPTVREFPTRKF
jgi:hypothetical protein